MDPEVWYDGNNENICQKKERKNETHQKVLQFEKRLEVKVPTADDKDVKHIFG